MSKRKRPPIYGRPALLKHNPSAGTLGLNLPQVLQQAAAAYSRRDWGETERLCRLVIQAKADHFDALNMLGIIAAHTQRAEEAAAMFERAIAASPHNASVYNNRGIILQQLDRLDEALRSYDRALKINPRFAEAHNNRGIILHQLKRLDEALDSFERALKIKPDFAEAYTNRGVTLQELKRLDEALDSCERAIKIKPGYAEAHFNRGVTLQELKRLGEALDDYDHALRIRPGYAEALNNRGVTLQQLQRLDEALDGFDRALKIKPDFAAAYHNRGITLQELERLDEALDSFDRALKIKPDYAAAYYDRGVTLQKLKRLDEALDSFDLALKIKPDYAEAYSNRGVTLQKLKRLDEALDSFDRALKIKPDYAEGNWNLSFCRLLMGDFARGWEGFEWLWQTERRAKYKKQIAKNWDGGKMQGPLLVLPEQGVGDEIFYSGMLDDLKGVADLITVCVDPRLVTLYERSFDHILVISRTAPLTADSFDAQIYMASLGRYFRADEQALKNIKVPYLKACPDRVKKLRSQVAGNDKLVCGLSWVSKNADFGAAKSLSLRDLRPILALPNVEFVNLQYGDTSAEQTAFYAECGLSLKNVPEVDNFKDIDGLAALIEACDVVVTVSNTTAHLAAALGKPVFVMLPFSVGLPWYWHLDREDSPWYPSAKLFRQRALDDWPSVLERVRVELARY